MSGGLDSGDTAGPGRGAQAQLFNFDTMSGVFPGTRTQVYQRVRLLDRRGAGAPSVIWAQILWYADPVAAVVVRQAPRADGGRELKTLARLEEAPGPQWEAHLSGALDDRGLQMVACGTCGHWQPGDATTSDGLPVGRCTLVPSSGVELPAALSTQSLLALDCPHWTDADGVSQRPADQGAHLLPTTPLPKAAELSDSKKPWLERTVLRVRRALAPKVDAPPLQSLMERSGVGAGTESCYSCQGRIANLGALAVESPEGDKQTFSVWRCRLCFTLYLSDWIDRWERVDSLETEETIYRIAPAEAAELLTVIAGVRGGDHPGRRRERNVQREWVLEQLAERPVLSHLIKQGR